MKAVIVFLIVCQNTGVIFSQDQCQNNSILPRDGERSQNNTAHPTNGTIPCDDSMVGWYRFSTGEISTSCVPPNHCGTSSTIWMRDPVPDTGSTQLNEFCVSHFSGSTGDVCCLFSFNVNVTNCGGYLVYNFTGDQILCPSGYCKGGLKTCPDDRGSPSGFEPCTWHVPAMYSSPVLEAPIVDTDGHDFTQTCNVMYDGSDLDAAFRVTWSFDGVFYKDEDITNGMKSANITSKDWIGHFGETLSCDVQSFNGSNGFSQHSRTLNSNTYFGGLMASSKDVTLSEGRPAFIGIKATLPVVCSNTPLKNCEVQMNVRVRGRKRNEVLIKDSCTLRLKASFWNDTKHEIHEEIQIASLIDVVFKSRHHYILEYSIQDTPESLYLGSNQTVAVNVTTEDDRHHVCMIIGSSQILVFNQDKVVIAGHTTGDCLMYKGTSFNGREIQVQTRLWRPDSEISSACGVAMQYGDVLIKVDMCSKNPSKTAPVITQGASDPLDVRVYLCDSDYEIVTTDGVRLSVGVRQKHLDLKLHIPPGYSIAGEGACSYHGHNHSFNGDEFRMHENTSLFADGALPFMKVKSSQSEIKKPYCECGSSTPVCDLFQAVGDPGAPIVLDAKGKMEARPVCSLVVPHALNPDLLSYPLVYNHALRPVINQNVAHFCKTKISTYSNHECVQNFLGGGLGTFTDVCYEDVTRGRDHDDAAVSAVQGFQWYCQEKLLTQKNRYSPDSEGYLRTLSTVTTDSCYGLCSLHGTCKSQGVCACDLGRAGVGCTVIMNRPPVIVDVKGNAHCPLSSKQCGSPTLIVRNVAPSEDLQVEVKAATMYPPHANWTIFHLEAIFDNIYSVTIPMSNMIALMPDHATLYLQIALTMDGKTYSNYINYVVFDDKCQLCVSDGCFQKEDTCHIQGECYLKNEINPANSSLVCDPSQGLVKWTEVDTSRGQGNPVVIG